MYDWAKELNCAVTVCDKEGNAIYQNDKSVKTNGNVVGQNILPCHSENSKKIIHDLIDNRKSHSYTIHKKGEKKLIYQTPWYQEGNVAGLVEFSIVIPEDMPHYDRG